MTTATMALSDSGTFLRRDLRHAVRFPMVTLSGLLTPLIMLLLFDGVFGRTLRGGLGTSFSGGYVEFVVPGVLVMAAGGVAEATALTVNTDMSGGIIARFLTMAIWRPSVLVGQVGGSVIRTLATGAAVCAVGIGLGFSPNATALGWVAAAGLFALLGMALSWLTMAFGLLAKSPAGANGLSLIPLFLPFVSSAFVPSNNMPAGVRAFAEYQPFTPIIDTLRGLLTGGAIGGHAVAGLAWCAGIAIVGFWCSLRLYERRPAAAAV